MARVIEMSKQQQAGKAPITKLEVKRPVGRRRRPGRFSCPVFRGSRR